MRRKDFILILTGLLILSGCGKTNVEMEVAEETSEAKTEVRF